MRAFLAQVLSPAFDALMPADAARVARRLRNAAAAAALVAGLMPRAGSLGTGTLTQAIALVMAYAGVAVLAHVVRERRNGELIAANQFGRHSETLQSYGRSMIVDPWGTVLGTAPDGENVTVCEIDMERQAEIRAQLPCLTHRRLPS